MVLESEDLCLSNVSDISTERDPELILHFQSGSSFLMKLTRVRTDFEIEK